MITIVWGRVTCHCKPIRGRVGRVLFTHSKACIVGHPTAVRHKLVNKWQTGMESPNNPKTAFFKWKYSHYFSLQGIKGTSVIMKCTLCPGQSASPRLCQVVQTYFNVTCFRAFHASVHDHEHEHVLWVPLKRGGDGVQIIWHIWALKNLLESNTIVTFHSNK